MAKQKSLTQAISHNLAEIKHLLEDTSNLVRMVETKINQDAATLVKHLETQASILVGNGEEKAPKGKTPVAGKAPRQPRPASGQGTEPRRARKAKAPVQPGESTDQSEAGGEKPKRTRRGKKSAAQAEPSGDPSPLAGATGTVVDRQNVKCGQCGKLVYSDDDAVRCHCGD